MDWKTSSQLEITDLGDRLEIMVRTQQGLLDWLFILVCAPAVVFLFVRSSQFMGILVAIVMGFSLLNNLRKGNETRMIVWSHGFRAEGNVHRTFASSVEVSIDDVRGIGYFVGYEDDPSGLYAFHRWSNTCLLPGLDESECDRVKAAIEARFPDMQFGQQALSGLFGGGTEIISLGLTAKATKNADTQNS